MVGTITSASLPTSSLAQEIRSHRVRAVYFEGQISFKLFRAHHPHYPVLSTEPLVIEPELGSYVALTKFGAVVFWNCPDHVAQGVIRDVMSLPGALNRNEAVEDTIEVLVGQDEDRVTFNEVRLRELTLEKIKLISRALGQSVALERFELEVTASLRRAEPVVEELKSRGGLLLSEKETLRTVGFALGVRAAVLANLTLFDDPPETWESEALAHLDSLLYDHFNLEERTKAINQKLEFLNDVNDTLMNLLHNRKNQRLEWIIIILILIEIVFFVVLEVFPRLVSLFG
jgi:uncharacterized Rmd1/YagE family protein